MSISNNSTASYHFALADNTIKPNDREVIFLDCEGGLDYGHFLEENFEQVAQYYEKNGYKLIYFPQIAVKIKDLDFELLEILYSKIDILHLCSHINAADLQNAFTAQFDDGNFNVHTPAFFHFSGEKDEKLRYTAFWIENYSQEEENPYIFYLNILLEQDRRQREQMSSIRFQILPSSDIMVKELDRVNFYDDSFKGEAQRLLEEIRDNVNRLEKIGLSPFMLKKILHIEAKPELSRLRINRDYRFFLPDFNNIEIEMTPLPKAIYILFLINIGGIVFKDLPDHRNLLMKIYKDISKRENIDDMRQSIEDLTDPTKNSINEKCSRIREAFLKHLPEEVAKYYYIVGERGEVKKINLPHDLVDLEK
ncbi:MAG: hypothetical protein LBS50_03410 [Prevotellaceae bacterium]|jgi:hypothetical protein|nr:hypothetical protein [Prevotellaceae bacterium]